MSRSTQNVAPVRRSRKDRRGGGGRPQASRGLTQDVQAAALKALENGHADIGQELSRAASRLQLAYPPEKPKRLEDIRHDLFLGLCDVAAGDPFSLMAALSVELNKMGAEFESKAISEVFDSLASNTRFFPEAGTWRMQRPGHDYPRISTMEEVLAWEFDDDEESAR